jgi:hypothetical protein
MVDAPKPLRHEANRDDAALASEERAHLSASAPLQLIAELVGELRLRVFPWWTPPQLRETWSAGARMAWLEGRPDLRQRITTALTGLGPNTARKKTPEFQATLIDAAIDDGDVTVDDFERAFDPTALAAYGPAGELWHAFMDRMPWREDSPPHRELIAWALRALLARRSSLPSIGERTPILTPWELRTAIDGRVWHTHLPIEIRVAIDEARFQREREKGDAPFHAADDLAIALPEMIAEHLPLASLLPIFAAAEGAMGLRATNRPPAPAEPAKHAKGAAKTPTVHPEIDDAWAAEEPVVPPPPRAPGPPNRKSTARMSAVEQKERPRK